MKRFIVFAALYALPALAQDSGLEPGLVGEYFDAGTGLSDFPQIPAGRKPTFVRVDKTVDFEEVEGDFYGSRLSQNFYVRWTGVLRVEKAGVHTLFSASDDGSRITVDGKLVLNNGGTHPMAEKSGQVDLAGGDHELKIEFFQAGGGAGIKVAWQPPGAGRQPIGKALFHRKASEAVEWDKAAWEKRPKAGMQVKDQKGAGKYALMDRGVLSSGTIDCLFGGKGNFANKGIAVELDREKPAAVCFDTELLKFTSGWTGGFIGWPAGRDGIEGQPFADGMVRFGSRKNTLGVSKDGAWKDPRPIPYGPLPREWGRYRGLYLHGDQVVLSYTAGDAEVLDLPGYDAKTDTFTRVINATRPCRLFVCEKDDALGVVHAAGEATVEVLEKRVELVVRPGKCSIAIGPGAPPAPVDLTPLTKGGPGRNQPVEVKGTLGKETGAFQVDTITVPYENPSKSYMRLTGVDFFSDGKRAAVCTLDGDVWIVSGIDEALEKVTWKRFASGLFQTLGLRIVDDQVYTLGRDQITRFHDLNGDGEADFYECFNNDCGVTPSYHEFTHDLHTDSQGNWYYAKGSNLGGAVVPFHGALIKVSKDGKTSEVWATGFRAPNGFSVGPGDVITTSDNQGNWTPSTPINYLTEKGQFCGFVPCSHQKPEPKERPLAMHWIPYNLDNSGGGQIWAGDKWGPFKNQLFHLSYGKCALFYILREKAGDLWQGGSVRFPFKFLSGSMRGRFNPVDGQMYVVGMRGWQTDANRDGCFQRVRYTGKPANLPLEAKVTHEGIAVTFTDPLERETASSLDSFTASWCNLRWTAAYGSDEYWVSEPNKKGREPLPIKSVALSPDGKTVTLAIDGLKPVYHLILKYRMKGADGSTISQELDYTINKQP